MAIYKNQQQIGLSYIEVLVASVLIAVSLVPALEALQPGIQGSQIHEDNNEDHYQLVAKMEEVLAEPYIDIQAAALLAASPSTASSYSDTVTLHDGRQISRSVFLSHYDADNADADNDPFTGTEVDLIWIKVVIDNSHHALQSLRAD